MIQAQNWTFIFVFTVGIIGLLVGNILFWVNKNNVFSSRLLACFLFVISIMFINYGLMHSSFFMQFPFLWCSANWLAFCPSAFSFLYVKKVLYPDVKLDYKYFFLFLPAVLYVIMLSPIYLLPLPDKLILIKRVLNDKTALSLETDVMLLQGTGTILKILFAVIISIAQSLLLFKWKKQNSKTIKLEDTSTLNWLQSYTTITLIICFILVIEYYFHLLRIIDLTQYIILSFSGMILFVVFYLLFQPNLLYGINIQLVGNSEIPLKREKENKLTFEQKNQFKEAIENHFKEYAPFTKKGYTINELSNELTIPVYLLSSFINEEYQKHFNELINEHRINYISNLLNESYLFSNFTIESLGQKAGFSSRSSLNSAVKKYSGKSSAEYFRIKKQEN